LFTFIDELIRFEFDILESNLVNLLILGGVVVCYVFFPVYGGFSKRKEYIKSALIKSMEAEEELRLALIESYYQVFLKQTFWLVSLLFLSRVIALDNAYDGRTDYYDGGTDYYMPHLTSSKLISCIKEERRRSEIRRGETPAGESITTITGYKPLPKVFNNPFVSPYARTCVFTDYRPGSQRRIMAISSSDNGLPIRHQLGDGVNVKFIENFEDLWPLVIIAAKDVFSCKKISDRSKHKKPMKTFLSDSDSKIRRIILKQDRRCIGSWLKLIEKEFPLLRRTQTLERKGIISKVDSEVRNWKVNSSMLALLAMARADYVDIMNFGVGKTDLN
jgi:hypothetical protein